MLGGSGSVTSQQISTALGFTPCPNPHGHTTFADITGLQDALDAKQAAGSYALSSHNHNGVYQAAGSYAAAVHTHVITDVTGLQSALDGKQASGSYALTSHNHDAAYAAIGHNHAGVYAPVSHSHVIADVTGLQGALDGKQAAGSYAAASHNHAGVYQPVGSYLTVFGYSSGSGGVVTQATNKSTAVTLNKQTGEITMAAGSG